MGPLRLHASGNLELRGWRARPAPKGACESTRFRETKQEGSLRSRRARSGLMLTRDLLSQILNQLPVGGILGPKLPLQASFAHRQFAGDLNKRRNVSNDAPGKDRQNPMAARPVLPEVIEKLPGLGVKDLQQHRIGREQVQLQVGRTEVYTILGLVKLHGQAKDPLMFRRTGRSRLAECDRKGLHVGRRQPPQRDERAAGHRFHRLPGRGERTR